MAEQAARDVALALAEDLGSGDLSADLLAADRSASARIVVREDAVLCGQAWVDAAFRALDPQVQLHWALHDGQRCSSGQVVLQVHGQTRALLSAERTALNFLQMLSGVASKTAQFVGLVAAANAAHGTRAQILDTRKTLPGLRLAQKYAVRCGGGVNHRIGLFDAVLLKENHIAAAGGVAQALALARACPGAPRFVQIELETLEQLQDALQHGATLVLLDNMDLPALRAAVALNRTLGARRACGPAQLEVSGGVNQDTVAQIAACGVDRISVGDLTKNVRAVDFSMRFQAQ